MGECSKSKTWLREFTRLLDPTAVPPVRLVGTTLNCLNTNLQYKKMCLKDMVCPAWNQAHLQSSFFVTDREGVELMRRKWFCYQAEGEEDAYFEVIKEFEIGTPHAFLNAGWNFASIQDYWKGHNFLDFKRTNETCTRLVFSGVSNFSDLRSFHKPDPYEGTGEFYRGTFRDLRPDTVIMYKTNRIKRRSNASVKQKRLDTLTREGNE